MRMPAEVTNISGDSDGTALLGMAVPLCQISPVMAKQAQISFRLAEGTGCLRVQRGSCGLLIPFFI